MAVSGAETKSVASSAEPAKSTATPKKITLGEWTEECFGFKLKKEPDHPKTTPQVEHKKVCGE